MWGFFPIRLCESLGHNEPSLRGPTNTPSLISFLGRKGPVSRVHLSLKCVSYFVETTERVQDRFCEM